MNVIRENTVTLVSSDKDGVGVEGVVTSWSQSTTLQHVYNDHRTL